MHQKIVNIDDIEALVFDFDGVLTNNQVHVNEDGTEWVSCSRADGLGFDALRKLNKPVYVLSTEKNPVVTARAKKLKIVAIQGVSDKAQAIMELANINNYDLKNILYVGNDLNDYYPIKICGHSACPADSHRKIKELSNFVLNTRGGSGVVRELLEDVFRLDIVQILY